MSRKIGEQIFKGHFFSGYRGTVVTGVRNNAIHHFPQLDLAITFNRLQHLLHTDTQSLVCFPDDAHDQRLVIFFLMI